MEVVYSELAGELAMVGTTKSPPSSPGKDKGKTTAVKPLPAPPASAMNEAWRTGQPVPAGASAEATDAAQQPARPRSLMSVIRQSSRDLLAVVTGSSPSSSPKPSTASPIAAAGGPSSSSSSTTSSNPSGVASPASVPTSPTVSTKSPTRSSKRMAPPTLPDAPGGPKKDAGSSSKKDSSEAPDLSSPSFRTRRRSYSNPMEYVSIQSNLVPGHSSAIVQGSSSSAVGQAPHADPKSLSELSTPSAMTKSSSGSISAGSGPLRRFSDLFRSSGVESDIDWGLPSSPKGTLRRIKAGVFQPHVVHEVRQEGLILVVDDTVRSTAPAVKAGTLEKLVERLTNEHHPDMMYTNAFLLTYNSFVSPTVLLDLLLARFNAAPPESDDPLVKSKFTESVLPVIQLRVVNVLKHWVERHPDDFRSNSDLTAQFKEKVPKTLASSPLKKPAESLMTQLDRALKGEMERATLVNPNKPPPPILPRNMNLDTLHLLDVHPEELARSVCLVEHDMYRAIVPQELLGKAWSTRQKETRAPNVLAMIRRFNTVGLWVTSEIVTPTEPKARAITLSRFIAVADFLRGHHNFNGVMEILAGLQHPAVLRLKRTWGLLSNRMLDVWKNLLEVMDRDGNYKNYREMLKLVPPPSLPYLGVFLSDLTFIADGNVDMLEGGKYINFAKRAKTAAVIRDLQQYQTTMYNFERVEFIENMLKARMAAVGPENELFSTSLLREPRERRRNAAAGGSKKTQKGGVSRR